MMVKSFSDLKYALEMQEIEHLRAMARASMSLRRLNAVADEIREKRLWRVLKDEVIKRDGELRGVNGKPAVWVNREGTCGIAVKDGKFLLPLPNGKFQVRSVIDLEFDGFICRPGEGDKSCLKTI